MTLRTLAAATLASLALLTGRADATGGPPVTVDRALRLASATYRVDYWSLRRRSWCESRWHTGAVNHSSHAAGLFQFLHSTWRTTPYRGFSVFDPVANALAAAWMVRAGRGGEWVCAG